MRVNEKCPSDSDREAFRILRIYQQLTKTILHNHIIVKQIIPIIDTQPIKNVSILPCGGCL